MNRPNVSPEELARVEAMEAMARALVTILAVTESLGDFEVKVTAALLAYGDARAREENEACAGSLDRAVRQLAELPSTEVSQRYQIVLSNWAATIRARLLAGLLLTLVLAGCAPTYGKPGLTQAEGDRDAYECWAQSQMLPRTPQSLTYTPQGTPVFADPSLGLGDVALSRRMLDACMKARGYTRE